MASISVTLLAPIQAHGDALNTLTLRPITGRDLRTIGDPRNYTVDGRGSATLSMNTAIMAAMISSLAGIPVSSVDQLTPPDWDAAQMVVMGFFASGVLAPAS